MNRRKAEERSLKQRLVEAAYDMMQEDGAEQIHVRTLAQRVGCSSTVLYKHFDNFNYLIALASVRILEPYIRELEINLASSGTDLVQSELNAWRLFNKYAFRNPYAYLNLFWGHSARELEEIFSEYLSMYPVFVQDKNMAFFYTSIFSGSIEERDYVWFRRAASEGLMDYDDARPVSQINCLIAHGLLTLHIADYQKPGVYEEAVALCNKLIEHNIRIHLKK